jgi:hypothetical protein
VGHRLRSLDKAVSYQQSGKGILFFRLLLKAKKLSASIWKRLFPDGTLYFPAFFNSSLSLAEPGWEILEKH